MIKTLLALEEEVVSIEPNVSDLRLRLLVLRDLVGELLARNVDELTCGWEVVEVSGEVLAGELRILVEVWNDNVGIIILGQVDGDSGGITVDEEAIEITFSNTNTVRIGFPTGVPKRLSEPTATSSLVGRATLRAARAALRA